MLKKLTIKKLMLKLHQQLQVKKHFQKQAQLNNLIIN